MDAASQFHFLRPLWLLALALLAPLLWVGLRRRSAAGAWRSVCDPHLLRHLVDPGNDRARRWPLALAALAWSATCLALAGPAWERLPVPAFRSTAQHVLVLNLSQSMNATDVAPSRVARARFELSDALAAIGEGQVGLVIFSEEPYVVAPISDDPRVVAEFVPILEPGLMPGRGARVDRAIDEARSLLEQAGATRGGIVLVTDGAGDDPDAALAAARAAADAGFSVSVLGVGSEAGAPVPSRNGFERDERGRARLAQLDVAALEALASAGDGRFARITADDRDIATVMDLGSTPMDSSAAFEETTRRSDAWRDMGIALVWLVALIAPLAFRRGWVSILALALLLGGSLSAAPARAEARDWLQRPDQRGADAFDAGRHAEAAELFEDPAWRAAALYRDGRFEESAALLERAEDAASLYNRGNALARAGRLEDAIASYDAAIEGSPEHADAEFNRELVSKLLEQQQQQEQQQQSSDESQSGGEGSDAEPSEGSESSESKRSQGGEEGDESDRSQQREPSGEARDESGSPSSEEAASGEEDPSEAAEQRAEADPSDDGEPEQAGAAEPQRDGADEQAPDAETEGPRSEMASQPMSEREQAVAQWLDRIADDPGGLLREKLRRRYARKRYEDAMNRRSENR